jgi:hypothetical protein
MWRDLAALDDGPAVPDSWRGVHGHPTRENLAALAPAFDDRFVARLALFILSCLALACASHDEARAITIAPAFVELAPAATPTSAPSAQSFRVMIGGDLMPHRPQLLDASSLRAALAPLTPLFRQADTAIANYETATGDVKDLLPHSLSLAAPVEWAQEVRASGLRGVTLANNHSCDLGRQGLLATLSATSEAGLVPIGAGYDPWAPRVVAERSGKKVCVVAWTTFSNETSRSCTGSGELAISGVGSVGQGIVKNAILRAKNECDAVIAVFHGGEEYVSQTRASLAMGDVAAE